MTSRVEGALRYLEVSGPPPRERQPEPRVVISSGGGRIRPRARLIRTIGAELISSEVVAILELVRNSYDADAHHVEIRFNDPHHFETATIEIADDGHGMTEEVLLGPWLEPATNYKSHGSKGPLAGDRSPGGRRRLGSKGVGRFAAQRLGHQLVVRSRAAGASTELEADFDWAKLDNTDQYLDELIVPWRKIKSSNLNWHGTSLFMSQLKDSWNEERFDRLRVALSRLLGPGLSEAFQILLVINGTPEEIKPFIDTIPAMYSIEGSVLNGGTCRIIYQDITGAKETWERTVMWPTSSTCGPFSFRISSWDLDKEAVADFLKRTNAQTGPRDFRRAIRDHSGISLYRDGFRILPYGESDNDWLRLDRRRVNNPTLRLSNNQILGWVRLTADSNALLRDQTNREGLVANEAYTHLQQIILELLSYLETRRFTARRALGLAIRSNMPSAIKELDPASDLDELLGLLTQSRGLASSTAASEIKQIVESRQASSLATVNHYKTLAGLGLISAKVISRLGHPLKQAMGEAEFLKAEVLSSEFPAHLKNDILAAVDKLLASVNRAQIYSEALESVANPDIQRSPVSRLARCIEVVADLFLEEFVRYNINFNLEVNADPDFSIAPSIIQQVVALILENASYWVRREKTNRKIAAYIYTGGFLIENNGPSVPKGSYERIFEPLFTTRTDAAGLGLTLARDLLNTAKGTIRCVKTQMGTGFEVRLSKS